MPHGSAIEGPPRGTPPLTLTEGALLPGAIGAGELALPAVEPVAVVPAAEPVATEPALVPMARVAERDSTMAPAATATARTPALAAGTKTVLCVIHAPSWGGLHGICEVVGPVCGALGWTWAVVVPPATDETASRLRRAGLEVIEMKLRRIRRTADPRVQAGYLLQAPFDVVRLMRLIRARRVAVVQVFGLIHWQAALAARLTGTPLVWQLHSDLPPPALRRLFSPIVRRTADIVMTAGTRLARTHPGIEALGDRLMPFFAPVDTARFRPDPTRRAATRAALGLAPGDIVIGTVGNRALAKNHPLLLQAAPAVLAANPEAVILIVGKEVDSQRDWYAQHALAAHARLDPKVAARVRFLIPDRPIQDYMNAFDIFALPSVAEGSPLVIVEAMASGLPVVATAVGSVEDTVEDGVNGWLVPSGDAAALAARLSALAGDADLRQRLGTAGQALAIARYDTRRCAETHIRAYEKATAV